jgi:hypothetical protein
MKNLLFVVCNNCFEQIAEPFVAAGFVLAGNLQQQAFNLIETAQAMARNRISQSRAQHHKLVLALRFRSARGAPDSAVQPAQLTARAGIHIAHPADDGVRLVVQIKTVVNQLVELDFTEHVGTARRTAPFATLTTARTIAVTWPAAGAIAAARTPFTLRLRTRTFAAFSAAFPWRPILAPALLRGARLAFLSRLATLLRGRFILRRGG